MRKSTPSNLAESPIAKPCWRIAGRRLFRLAERCFALIGLSIVLYALFFDLARIVSPSMSPTLKGTSIDNGDRILTEKITYRFRLPRRFEVITFLNNDGVRVMKRVIGLPGETIQQELNGPILIDGRPLDMPPTVDQKYLRYGNLADGKPIPCGEGYYVLGDYTRDSDDSRFNGPVATHRIVGRAWLIVSPWSRFGWVNP